MLQKNFRERLPSARVFWLFGMLGKARASCVRRLRLRSLLVRLFGGLPGMLSCPQLVPNVPNDTALGIREGSETSRKPLQENRTRLVSDCRWDCRGTAPCVHLQGLRLYLHEGFHVNRKGPAPALAERCAGDHWSSFLPSCSNASDKPGSKAAPQSVAPAAQAPPLLLKAVLLQVGGSAGLILFGHAPPTALWPRRAPCDHRWRSPTCVPLGRRLRRSPSCRGRSTR